ncbi:MAG TPA: AraC family transcriptional regulator [Pyrinomonadaceae bacterium]|nr:AraC family transcriptional regulator [Pyrinomonadaceae bacterium]
MRAEVRQAGRDSWSGSVFLWDERGLFLGQASGTSSHAPHAVKICLAAHGSFRLRRGADAAWRECRAALVPPDEPHQIDGRGARLALFYLLPETPEGQQVLRSFSGTTAAAAAQGALSKLSRRVKSYLDHGCDGEEAADLCDEMVFSLTASAAPCAGLDGRVAQALAYLRSALDRRVTSEEIAQAVSLSPSRIAHLFREQAGLPLRRYVLWLRLCAALDRMALSDSLTDAAHAAGFADSAHLSRTFRRMHGITPSALLQHSRFFHGAK